MYSCDLEQVYTKLGSSKSGISTQEAAMRLKNNGRNVIEKEKKQSFIVRFLRQFLNIMVMILLVSAIISISIAIIDKQYSDLFEGFVILFIVIMNALIGVLQEDKAQACLDDLQKYSKILVKVIRQGEVYNIDSSELVIGDVVEFEAGNVVSADIRLIDSNNLSCDESSLTGESEQVDKNADISLKSNTPLGERRNMVYSGSMVTRGKARGIVVSTGRDTEMGKIANMLFRAKKDTTPLQKSIDKIGKIITWTVLAVCGLILVIELVSGHGVMNAIMTSVALAVAAIPESLPAVITIILALGVQQLAKRRVVIKRLHAVETLGSCEIICTDKTGTLTCNKMQVIQIESADADESNFLKCMITCNNTKTSNNGEPTELALYSYASTMGASRLKVIHEIPFDSNRKMMTVLVNENGIRSYTKGASERIIEKCQYIQLGGEIMPFGHELKEKYICLNNQMTDKALRVIGFAMKICEEFDSSMDFEQDMVFLGLAGLMDNPRPEVKASIERCFQAGLKPVMITGDHKRTAFAIAQDLSIAKSMSEVVTGDDLDKMTDKELKKNCMRYSVYARVSPEHKVRIVQAFKANNKIVAMTGDGVNDAPSLKIADIGVGMGQAGTDVVKNVADMIITDDNFSSIVIAVEEGRKVYNNIQKALQFLISTNCVEIFGMLIALVFFPGYSFLIPSHMLYVNLVTDSLPAFALGLESVEPEIMRSPPRDSHAGLFSGKVGIAIIYQSILQTMIVMGVFAIGIYCYSEAVASTMVFFTIIFMQLLHSVNCKTNNSIFEKNLLRNKTFNVCFLITLGLNLMVACVPFMYRLFGLEFLGTSEWIIVIIASIIIIPACELIKIFVNSRTDKPSAKQKHKNRIDMVAK